MLTSNKLIRREDGILGGGPVAADQVLFIGAMAFVNLAGYITSVTATGANKFAGIVRDFVDATGAADGDKTVNFFERSSFVLKGTGFTISDVGKKVYAIDDEEVSLSGAGVYVGTITRFHSDTEVLVALDIQTE